MKKRLVSLIGIFILFSSSVLTPINTWAEAEINSGSTQILQESEEKVSDEDGRQEGEQSEVSSSNKIPEDKDSKEKVETSEINPGAPNSEEKNEKDLREVESTVHTDLKDNTIDYSGQSYQVTFGFNHSATDAGKTVQVKIPDIFVSKNSNITSHINKGSLSISEPYLEGLPFSDDFKWQGGYWVIDVTMPDEVGYSELIVEIKAPNYPLESTLSDMGVDGDSLPIGVYDNGNALSEYDQHVNIPRGNVGPPSMSVIKDNRLNLSKPQYLDAQNYAANLSLPVVAQHGFGKLTSNAGSNTIMLAISAPYASSEVLKPAKNVEGEFIIPKELDIVPSGAPLETPSGYRVQSERLEIDPVTGMPTGNSLGADWVQYTEGRGSSANWIETVKLADGSKKVTFHTDSLNYNRRIYYEIPVISNSVHMVEGYKYPQYVSTSKALWEKNGTVETVDNLYVYQTFDKIVPTSYSAVKKITNNTDIWAPGDKLSYQITLNVLKDDLSVVIPDFVNELTPVLEDTIKLTLNGKSENVNYVLDKNNNSLTIDSEHLKVGDKIVLDFDVSTDNVSYGDKITNTFTLFGSGSEIGYLDGNTVTANFGAAPVTVKYQDEAGNDLAPSDKLNGKVGMPYETTAKSIDGWTVKTVPANASGTFTTEAQEVVYIYERTEAAPVTVKYQDEAGNDLAPSDKLNGKVGMPYETTAKSIDGWTVKTVPANASGTFTTEAQEVVYIYERTEAAPVTVKYQDEAGNDLAPSDKLNGKVGMPYETTAKSIDGWTVKTVPANASGTFTTEAQEVVYIYERTEAAPVTVKYQDEAGNDLAPSDKLNGKVGMPYETTAKSIDGWTVKTVPANASGTFTTEAQEVVYIYERTEAAPVTVKYQDEAGNDLAPSDKLNGKVGMPYETTAKSIDGWTVKTVPANASGTFTTEAQEVVYIYERTEAAPVTVKYQDEAGNDLAPSDKLNGKVGMPYETTAKSIDGWTVKTVPANASGTFTTEAQEVVYIYERTEAAPVTVKYQDEAGNDLAPSDKLNGKVGMPYETTAKSIDGWTVKTVPANASGTFTTEAQEVVYIYERTDKNVTTPGESTDNSESPNSSKNNPDELNESTNYGNKDLSLLPSTGEDAGDLYIFLGVLLGLVGIVLLIFKKFKSN